MSRPVPPHGHPNRYAYGCRCQPCTRAASRADTQRRLDRMAGRPRSVPPGPVVEHLRALTAAGLTYQQISRESSVERSTVARLLSGRQKSVRRATADKLLAVPLTVRPTVGDVPSLGATRRLRALYALGHFNYVIAEEAGISRDAVCALVAGQWSTLKVGADEGIRAAYDRLSMRVGSSWKTRRLAEREGWAPPLAWDEESIDDPNAVPQLDAETPEPATGEGVADRWLMGEAVVLDDVAKREVIQHLMEWTELSTAEVAGRLEMNEAAVKRTWERIKARARKAGGPVPYRRLVVTAAPQKIAA